MLVLLLFLLFMTPVTLTIVWDKGLSVGIKVWGLGRARPVATPASNQASSGQRFLRILGTLLRTDRARRFLFRHVDIISVQGLLRLGLQSAAFTAVYAGLLQILAQLLPGKADIRVQPDFLHPTRLQLRCIVFFHLGTLLITAGMTLWAYYLETHEHPAPHPKEA